MPVMDGLEASKKITEMNVKTPIVALTANIMANDIELYRSNGMYDLLGKPFTSHDLWQCLLKYLSVTSFVTRDKHLWQEEEDRSLKQLRIYFVDSNQTTFEKIMDAIENDDIKAAHRLVHTLKSNAGQINEKNLQRAAAEVEVTLMQDNFKLKNEQANVLKDELNAVLEKLAPLSEKSKAENNIEVETDNEVLWAIIEKLEPILQNHSTECVQLIDDARSIPGSEALVRCMDEFEFRQAVIELEEIKKRLGRRDDR